MEPQRPPALPRRRPRRRRGGGGGGGGEEPGRTDFRHSAGGVLVRGREVILIASKTGRRWRLPKGRLEPGETSEQAALRETREETGIVGRLRESLPGIEYWYTEGGQRRVHKRVDFYLLEYVSGEPVEFDRNEVAEAAWFTWEEGLEKLWFENERSVLRRARELYEACPPIKGANDGDGEAAVNRAAGRE